ncbi:MAG: molecular chaperone DnaJ [Anaerolineae bacterium]|jgi:molecular chaperone DnaJ
MATETKRDYYEVLGVSRDASKEDLRAAYRRLARKYHPDVSKDHDAEERFKEINEAYQVLNDDERRAQYDRFGHAGLNQADMGGFGFSPFEDIFAEMFGFGGARSGPARRGPYRGNDLRYDLEVSFEEAVFGVERDISLYRKETCDHCQGSGAEPGTTPVRCSDCGGSGQIRRAQQSIFGSFVNVSTCPRCGGTGEVITTPCNVCRGAMQVDVERTLRVSVPAGVDDGMRVRLAGEGDQGLYGGPAGNLYVMLHVRPHKYFQRRENDILLNININISQAALGDVIKVPTLDGEAELKIEAGTQPGSVSRLRGKGVPRLRGAGRGDQIVLINVQVPTRLSEHQRELLAELGETLGSDVSPQTERGFLDRLKDTLGL